jgi:hypothetical protein
MRNISMYVKNTVLKVLVVRLSSQNVHFWRFKDSQPIWLGVFFYTKIAFVHIAQDD